MTGLEAMEILYVHCLDQRDNVEKGCDKCCLRSSAPYSPCIVDTYSPLSITYGRYRLLNKRHLISCAAMVNRKD